MLFFVRFRSMEWDTSTFTTFVVYNYYYFNGNVAASYKKCNGKQGNKTKRKNKNKNKNKAQNKNNNERQKKNLHQYNCDINKNKNFVGRSLGSGCNRSAYCFHYGHSRFLIFIFAIKRYHVFAGITNIFIAVGFGSYFSMLQTQAHVFLFAGRSSFLCYNFCSSQFVRYFYICISVCVAITHGFNMNKSAQTKIHYLLTVPINEIDEIHFNWL